ncbi:hypothetical protein ACH4GE_40735 [Streptomyces tendae]|uniref:hypothetical protein n=1 Tax=Streptomyces tendae TaxID=1932 RepID=UPI0037BAF2F7
MSSPLPPSWLHCGHGADQTTDRIGRHGVQVPDNTECLAHLTDTDRTAYMPSLAPGANIDHRGTPFTPELLEALLNALTDPTTGKPHLGRAGAGRPGPVPAPRHYRAERDYLFVRLGEDVMALCPSSPP